MRRLFRKVLSSYQFLISRPLFLIWFTRDAQIVKVTATDAFSSRSVPARVFHSSLIGLLLVWACCLVLFAVRTALPLHLNLMLHVANL